ncbi:BRO family, N-terminal domain protein [Leptotrichia hofstadii F0254]|jgi:toxin-antitoxin system, toxin component, bro family|uniref:BRO family, N-terminal domain protein n=2 Tax=Leptotrichia hofstadii TaxID=157688 RepID=C9MVA7_9FUSO|nr:BRO family, N-terminal domain protein [Leptotrichia hofstadii F0254]
MEDKRMYDLKVINDERFQIFSKENLGSVRTILVDNEVWFCIKDVCDILELTNPTVVAKRLDEDEVTKFNLGSKFGITNFTNESGLYTLILRSDKKEAKPFRKWITSEVIPAIRKTGKYEEKKKPLTQAELILQQAQWMVEAESRINNIENNVIGLANTIEDNDKSIKRLENNQRRTVTSNHLTVIAYANIKGIKPKSYHAPSIGKKATKICREKDLLIGTTVDSRYGLINTYPVEVLDEIFFE